MAKRTKFPNEVPTKFDDADAKVYFYLAFEKDLFRQDDALQIAFLEWWKSRVTDNPLTSLQACRRATSILRWQTRPIAQRIRRKHRQTDAVSSLHRDRNGRMTETKKTASVERNAASSRRYLSIRKESAIRSFINGIDLEDMPTVLNKCSVRVTLSGKQRGRLVQLVRLLSTGHTQTDCAGLLRCSVGTISNLVLVLRQNINIVRGSATVYMRPSTPCTSHVRPFVGPMPRSLPTCSMVGWQRRSLPVLPNAVVPTSSVRWTTTIGRLSVHAYNGTVVKVDTVLAYTDDVCI